MHQKINPGLYQHYKTKNLYQVLSVARHSENPLELFVVYQALYYPYNIWIRPLDMFIQSIPHEGTIVQRFQFIENNNTENKFINKRT